MALRRGRDPGVVDLIAQRFGNDLEMEVRRPAAIFVEIANLTHSVPGGERGSRLETTDRGAAEVAVKGVEFDAVKSMARDHRRAIVAKPGVVFG